MPALATVAGAALILLVIGDIFTMLFRPGAERGLSGGLARGLGMAARAAGRGRGAAITGPLLLAGVITGWALGLILGWTLIYLPHYPSGFAVTAAPHASFVGALHVSLAALTTLGSTGAAPRSAWLQIAVPVEAVTGLALLSAAVAYLLQLYPLLSRRRTLAYEIHLLTDAAHELALPVARLDAGATSQLLADMTSRVIEVERDLVKFPLAYHFHESDPRFALGTALPALADLAAQAGRPSNGSSVRLRARMLERAIDDLAQTVARRGGFPPGGAQRDRGPD